MTSAIEKIRNGVFIITAKSGDILNGLTAAWVSQASFVPPLVSVSIGKPRYTHEIIKKGKNFAVNIIASDQIDLARHFGFGSGRNKNKFEGIMYKTAKTGAPILPDCAGWMDCRVIHEYDAGDHTIFIGEVIDSGTKENKEPYVYNREDFY